MRIVELSHPSFFNLIPLILVLSFSYYLPTLPSYNTHNLTCDILAWRFGHGVGGARSSEE